jgi:hypothetical protein
VNPQTEVALVTSILNALTTWLQNKNRTDIPQEMQEAMVAAHAELARINQQP